MQNIKNFLIAFGVGIIMFGILAIIITQTVKTDTTDKNDRETSATPIGEDGEISDDGDELPYSGGRTFTAVVGGYDSDSGELDGLVFIKADKEHKRFVIAAIPTSSSVTVTSTDPASGNSVKTNVRIKDFPRLFRDSEKDTKIVDTVHAITGMKIDYYAFFTTSAAMSLFDKTGGLYYTVPQNMVYVGNGTEANPEIKLSAGGQVLSSKQIIQLLRFASYTTDERKNDARRAQVHADFMSEALIQILKKSSGELSNGIVDILADCETNFSVSDFKNNYDIISCFDEYKANSVITSVELSDPLEYTYTQKFFENYK